LILLGLTSLRLALRRTLLGLTFLGLIRLTLLGPIRLTLLTSLFGLSGLTRFALALTSGVLIALSFTPFCVALLALSRAALITAALIALALLSLTLRARLTLALLAFFLLARRLFPLPLAPLGLAILVACSWLLALLSSSPLSIAALRLTVPASRPALGLNWASRLPAARRVLG